MTGTPGRDQPRPGDEPPYRVPHNPEPVRIIHADEHLLLIHKPDLLLSVPGRHPLNRDCMISRLQERYPEARIVHRLDLDTSGVMVVARGPRAQSRLSRLFQERAVHKRYHAWVAGVPRRSTGSIELPIARDWERRPRQRICHRSGKPALTHYRVLATLRGCSYLQLTPVTGRSHQLRIHCRELGHPILGCDLYAPPKVLGMASRLMLHASAIGFRHPMTGVELLGHSPAPFSLGWLPSEIAAPVTPTAAVQPHVVATQEREREDVHTG